jgi:hypothetical protein
MFRQDFVNNVLVPNLTSQPPFLHGIVSAGIYVWSLNPMLSDIAAALLQITIGVLMLFPLSDRRFKIGAYASIVWGVIVWFCGEGAGLLLTGTASFYTGAPGAVLLYVLLAILLLVPEKINLQWLPRIAGWTLIAGAALQLQSVFWTKDGAQGTAMAAMMESMRFLKVFPMYISNLLGLNPAAANILLIVTPLTIGLLLLLKPNRITGSIALGFLLLIWWVGQDFGMLSSGTGTDPNTAPLIALFILPLFLDNRKIQASKGEEKNDAYWIERLSPQRKDGLIKFMLLLIIVLGSVLTVYHPPSTSSAVSPGSMTPVGMTLKTFDVPASETTPTIVMELKKDTMDGWDLHVVTAHFTFTPQKINGAPVAGEGHVHLYIDNTLYVMLGPWYHIDGSQISPGTHTITVTLNNNDHSVYAVNGKYIQAQQQVVK